MFVVTPDAILANHYNQEYPKQLWWFIMSFLLLVGVTNHGTTVLRKLSRKKEPADVEAVGRASQRAVSIRRLLLTIANTYRVLAFRMTLTIGPFSLNLAEVALTVAYIITLFVCSFINTTSLAGKKLDLMYFINRTANIACSQLPLVVALGTKNNIVGIITGLSYEKINYMHRMTARVVFVLLWVHSGSRLRALKPESLHEGLTQSGITAISAFSFLLVASLRPVRKAAYEIFLFLHIIVALLFLVGGYLHAEKPGVSYWFSISLSIWGLDRLVRFVRFIVFNHSYRTFKQVSGKTDASVELLSPRLMRLRLRKPPHFHWSPGQMAYLTMPGVSTVPFEAHPFTIASVDTTCDSWNTVTPIVEMESLGETEPYWKELVFLINVHGGFTKKLRNVAEKGEKVEVSVEGPYGKPPDLTDYDTSVLIAGGSGVSFTLPLLLDGIKNVTVGKSNTKRITFIWSIRDPRHIPCISETLRAATKLAPRGLTISIRVYLTRDSTLIRWDDVSDSSCKEKDEPRGKTRTPSLLEASAVQVIRGSRPNLKHLLQEEADFTSGRMGVTVCGSQSVVAAVKDALRFSVAGPSSIIKGGPSITLHTEAFGYA